MAPVFSSRRAWPLAVALVLGGCAVSSQTDGQGGSENVGSDQAQIRNGTGFDGSEPPQFWMTGFLTSPIGWCTGVVVQRNVVLTARHCLVNVNAGDAHFQRAGESTAIQGNYIQLFDGNDLAMLRVRGDPWEQYAWIYNNLFNTNSGIPWGGNWLTAIGYGQDQSGVAGVLRKGTLVYQYNLSGQFLVSAPGSSNQMICPGDSGGPLFFQNQVVGIANSVSPASGNCSTFNTAYHVDTYPYMWWIDGTRNWLASWIAP